MVRVILKNMKRNCNCAQILQKSNEEGIRDFSRLVKQLLRLAEAAAFRFLTIKPNYR
jgi:hypothetical protein